MLKKFKAFIVDKNKDQTVHGIKDIEKDELMSGNVLVEIKYSSFNFKDGLAVTGKLPIIKKFPMIPGVDFVGSVIESSNNNYKKNDLVILNGWGVGEKHFGGFSQYARVNEDWLIPMPKRFSEEEAMIIGSAGYTASLCVLEVIQKIKPEKGKILVTGASGGVGSVAIHLLSKLGYKVTGLSGKNKDFLLNIGATEVLNRKNFNVSEKPLQSEKWAGAIDTVGSDILSTILSETTYDGIVACTGLAKGPNLNTTVFPFILRNVTLAGVDCVYASYEKRVNAWKFLEDLIDVNILEKIKSIKSLEDIPKLSNDILAGKIQGRTVIDVNK